MLRYASYAPRSLGFRSAPDRIGDALREDGHRIWGFTIYRTVYPSNITSDSVEEDWNEFITRLDWQIKRVLTSSNRLDLEDSFTLTIFDDKNTLDGATTEQVREKFRAWIAEGAVASEQGEGTQAGRSQRYRFCIMVDAESLHSVVHKALAPPKPDPFTEGFVRLIKQDWDFEEEKRSEEEDQALLLADGCEPNEDLDDPDEPPFGSVEGCETRDVGWMKIAYTQVMIFFYGDRLRETWDWHSVYKRPPEIARG